MLSYTGHPFVDVGIAAITAYSGQQRPEDVTEEHLHKVVAYIQDNYPRSPLRGYLTMAFTSNGWFIQNAFNPDKPELTPQQQAERRQTRDRWAAHHLRQWERPSESETTCVFTGLPAAPFEVSGKLNPGRAGRAQVPLLQGDDTINFFANGQPGLPVSGLALLALQFLPMGCIGCGNGLLAIHCDQPEMQLAIIRRFVQKNLQDVILAQTNGAKKMPRSDMTPRTLLIDTLMQIDNQRESFMETGEWVSLTAYNVNNGKSPQIDMYHLPIQTVSFLRIVRSAAHQRSWQLIVQRAWQQETSQGKKKDALKTRRNYLYEDMFALPQRATLFVRRYLLRIPERSFTDDPRSSYSTREELELVSWPITELFLRKVLNMDKERLAILRVFADRLAEYTRTQGGKRFFFRLYTLKRSEFEAFRGLLLKACQDSVKSGHPTLITDEEFVQLFLEGDQDDARRPDWLLRRDLILIRMIDQLKPWLSQNPDAFPDEPSSDEGTDK